MKKKLLPFIAILIGLFMAWVFVEILAQFYYYFFLTHKIEREMKEGHGAFIFKKSENPEIGYDLLPNQHFTSHGWIVNINKEGLRENNDSSYAQKKRIALIGDSVVFGFRQTQDSTLSSMTQSVFDSDSNNTKIFNMGVPGYSSYQIANHLYEKNETFHFNEVWYMLNPNDFSVLNTVYEGGDNGTNRFFNPPIIKTPWFIRKLIYKYYRNADTNMYNQEWYNWIFNGTKDLVFNDILEMAKYCAQKNIQFSVYPLPSGAAYQGQKYGLDQMNSEIIAFLQKNKISHFNLVDTFKKVENPRQYFDETDHFNYRGNDILVKALTEK